VKFDAISTTRASYRAINEHEVDRGGMIVTEPVPGELLFSHGKGDCVSPYVSTNELTYGRKIPPHKAPEVSNVPEKRELLDKHRVC